MEDSTTKLPRLEWMDILRGLLILCVVIGHATGRFNRYIYQFHMGAFFIVSGYLSCPEKRGVLQTVYHRFFTTYLPLLSATVFLGLLTALMDCIGCYDLFIEDWPYVGLKTILREFFIHGNFYVQWLGASWFALTLFQITILNRCILAINANNYRLGYVFLSVLLFLWGYVQIDAGGSFSVWIAQFYYMIGTILRRRFKPNAQLPIWFLLSGLMVSSVIMCVIGNCFGFTVDFPSRQFNTPLIDVAMSINGCLLCFFVSKIIEKFTCVKKLSVILGRNTLPIMLFHFAFFKAGYWILYLFGVVPFTYLRNFVPTVEIGKSYWILLTIISIALSIFLWKCLTCCKLLRFVWGQEKDIYDRLWIFLHNKKKLASLWKNLSEKRIPVLVCCVVMALILMLKSYDIYYVGSSLESCAVEVGYYEDGWCEDEVRIKIKTDHEGIISLKGWTNASLTGAEKIVVFCDGVEATRYHLQDNAIAFSFHAKENSVVTLEICSNFCVPENPPDVRRLAFILTELEAF